MNLNMSKKIDINMKKDIEKHLIDKEYYKSKFLIEKLLSSSDNSGNYYYLSRLIKKNKYLLQFKKIKLAIVCSFAIKPIENFLILEGFLNMLDIEIYFISYGMYEQEVIDTKSGLYSFKPDIIIVNLWLKDFFPDLFSYNYYINNDFNTNNYIISGVLGNITKNVNLNFEKKPIVLIHNFDYPNLSVREFSVGAHGRALKKFIDDINFYIDSICKENSNIIIFNQKFCTYLYGYNNIYDENQYLMSQNPVVIKKYLIFAKEYMGYFKSFLGKSYKCIALDADNTLWGGIVGEDGIERIGLGDSYPGSVFKEFQKLLFDYYQKGILLILLSKNNEEDVLNVLENHPHMILRKEHFVKIIANWNNKPQNLIGCVKELNIGLDSVVFVDDNPHERELMRIIIPEVLTLEMPKLVEFYKETLEGAKILEKNHFTEEDSKRSKMYQAEEKRQEYRSEVNSLEDYYKGLEMSCIIVNVDKLDLLRIENLVHRTNQFNMTTKRYGFEELKGMLYSSIYDLYYIKYKDKYGDSGIVGLIIIKKQEDKNSWEIDTFLMSCRVLGKQVEDVFFNYIVCKAKNEKIDKIYGLYIKTDKNGFVKNYYQKFGFIVDKEMYRDNYIKWVGIPEKLSVADYPWIHVVNKE